jgi:hypothetical protein
LIRSFEVRSEISVEEQGCQFINTYLTLGAQSHVIFGRSTHICAFSGTGAGLIVLVRFHCVLLGGGNADYYILIATSVSRAYFLGLINYKRSFASPLEHWLEYFFLVLLLGVHRGRRRQPHTWN